MCKDTSIKLLNFRHQKINLSFKLNVSFIIFINTFLHHNEIHIQTHIRHKYNCSSKFVEIIFEINIWQSLHTILNEYNAVPTFKYINNSFFSHDSCQIMCFAVFDEIVTYYLNYSNYTYL